jgi:hypothetical protein
MPQRMLEYNLAASSLTPILCGKTLSNPRLKKSLGFNFARFTRCKLFDHFKVAEADAYYCERRLSKRIAVFITGEMLSKYLRDAQLADKHMLFKRMDFIANVHSVRSGLWRYRLFLAQS